MCSCNNKPRFKDGNLKKNMSDFSEPFNFNEESSIVDCYFKNVKYSVVNTDIENKTITLDVTIPDFSTILKNSININYISDNTEDYEEFIKSVKSSFEDNLNNPSHPTLNKQITLPIDKNENDKWKIVPNDEFYDFISESIYKALEEE